MKIIMIEEDTLKAIIDRFNSFASKVDFLFSHTNNRVLKKWLDSQEVCQILNVSKRTLQSYRNKRIIPYSQIGNKIYYKQEDIEDIIDKQKLKL